MNIRVVLNVLGVLLFFIGLSHVFPIAFTLYYNDADLAAFIWSAFISITAGLLLFLFNREHREVHERESLLIVSSGWIVSAAFGALPFCFYPSGLSFTDAYFEVMSGLTTTGASILNEIEALPHGLLFWRSFMHWLGGMGIIVLSLAILPALGVGGMQLFKAEVPGPSHDKLTPRIQETAKLLWGVYVLLTGVQAGLLLLGEMNLFDSLCHTFGTMATGGFSTQNDSITGYPAYSKIVVTIFMFLAGINFALHYRVFFQGHLKTFHKDNELRLYFFIALISAILIAANLFFSKKAGAGQALLDAGFQAVSILTTTGFVSADYEKWPALSQTVLFALMFVGGCAGSTGGGIKVVRILLLGKYTFAELKRLIHPKAIIPIRLGPKPIHAEVVIRTLGFTVLYFFLLILAALLLAMMGIDLATSISAAISTVGNIGPGFAAIGPMENYSHFPDVAKWLLSFCMLMGRLELFTVLVFFSRGFWKK